MFVTFYRQQLQTFFHSSLLPLFHIGVNAVFKSAKLQVKWSWFNVDIIPSYCSSVSINVWWRLTAHRPKSADCTDEKRGCGRQGDVGHLRRIIFAGMVPDPPFGITSRQNMQSLWLVAQRGADSKCPRQKLFHIPQQEGLLQRALQQENGSCK